MTATLPDSHHLSRDRPENAQIADTFGHNPDRRSNHENAGGHFDFGAAHNWWSGLYGPAFHQQSGGRSTGELSRRFQGRVFGGTIAMLSVDQFLRLMCLPAVFFAFVVASQISTALNPPPAFAMVSD
jgi:hypothetical protein